MSPTRPVRLALRPYLRVAALGATLALAACTASDSSGRTTSQSGGDVTEGWNPGTVGDVKGVGLPAVQGAIQSRLDASRPSGLSDDHWDHVKGLYKHYQNSPLWLDDDGLRAKRVSALTDAMLDAEKDALRLDEYPFAELTSALRTVRGGKPTAEMLANADVLLTAAYVALGEDLMTGQVSPRDYKQDWHIAPSDKALDSALARGLVTDALEESIAAMRPQDAGYNAIREQLARYRELTTKGGWGTVPTGRALKPGERDNPARLEALRARLRAEGYDVPSDSTVAGTYDRGLAGAVAHFQANHAIDVDSILGTGTVESLNKPAAYRLAQIAANLERYRWMPRSLGSRYVYVNVPAFKLTAFENGQPALEMKVIVGQNYQDKTTPVFADSMETVVFRPYWNITDDIADKEIIPKSQADPNYLAANQIETYQEGGKTRYRQIPGDKNSLGYVKFLFPNDFNIYLHDTPEHSLFDKDVRAFSHGCIRVEKPAELAQWVLGWDAAKVDAAMHSGPDNKSVKVPQKVPVYITYFTTYVDNGELHFGNDLYDRDSALVTAAGTAATPSPAIRGAVEALRDSAGL